METELVRGKMALSGADKVIHQHRDTTELVSADLLRPGGGHSSDGGGFVGRTVGGDGFDGSAAGGEVPRGRAAGGGDSGAG